MIQYVCDRCGKVVETELFRVRAAEFKHEALNILTSTPDICRQCVTALDDWLKPLPKCKQGAKDK
jgi:hypothetical protein